VQNDRIRSLSFRQQALRADILGPSLSVWNCVGSVFIWRESTVGIDTMTHQSSYLLGSLHKLRNNIGTLVDTVETVLLIALLLPLSTSRFNMTMIAPLLGLALGIGGCTG
jgi:hypothetical protein